MNKYIKTILFIVSIASFSVHANDNIYLYVFFHDDNSNGERFRTQMPDMKACLDSLKYAKMPIPTSPGGDYEVMGAMWCGLGEFNRNFSNLWLRDKVKQSKK